MLTPSQCGKWLGFNIDTKYMKIFVPSEKIEALNHMMNFVLNSKTIAIGPLTRLFTRQMYSFIETRKSWYEKRLIDNLLFEELSFWLRNLENTNGFEIRQNQATSKIIYSDASNSGYGGYIVEKSGKWIAKGNFARAEIADSSTYRELLAVKLFLQSVSSHLKNENVLWFSDNSNVSRIIQVGSRKLHLHRLSIEIFDICIKNNIKFQPSWISREGNVFSDFLSKHIDSDSWGFDLETFYYIQSKFGIFTVDRFTDDLNKKINNFNSKFYCPNSSGVNAFTYDWSGNFN